MKNVIFYVAIVALTIYIEIMYRDFYGLTLLAFEILLFLALFLLSRYMKRNVTVGINVRIPAAQKGEEIPVEVDAQNRGIFPVTKLCLRVEADTPRGTGRVKVPVMMSAPARRKNRTLCLADAEYCGRYRFRAVKGRVYDYLGLFSHRVRCEEEAYVNVLPGFYQMEIEVSERTRNFPVDGDEYDPHRSGDDPSEIFQVREFRDGDTLQRVHWKLSAKADELMTKELARPVGCGVLFLIDLHMLSGKDSMQTMDAVTELSAALSFSMWEAGVRHLVAWFDEAQGGICRVIVREEEQVYEMADRFLGAVPCAREFDLQQAYLEEYPGERFSSILCLDTDLRVQINSREAAVFQAEHLREQISGCLLEV